MSRKKLVYFTFFTIFSGLLLSEANSTSQVQVVGNKFPKVSKSEPKYITPASSPLYDTAGYTFYDLQAPDRLQREIAIDSMGIVHAVWTKGLDSTSSVNGPREVYYSSWAANGTRLTHEVQVSELGARGGYPSIAVLPDGRAVCVYHHVNTLSGGRTDGLYASIEQTSGLGDFAGEIHLPDSVNGMGDAAMWPACAAQQVDDSVIIHVVGIEGPNASGHGDFVYTRGVESPQDTFTFSPAKKPDSSDVISIIVVASRKSNKVAMVYSRQKSFSGIAEDADIFYMESTEGGRDWVNGFGNDVADTTVNVTKYQPGDPVRVFGDLSAVYDEEDSLHIVWIAPLYSSGYLASECYICHWSKATGIDQVTDGTFIIDDTNLPWPFYNLRNPHIGVHNGTGNPCRKNFLYVSWTQFGPATTDTSVGAVDGIINGELYVNASTNKGNTWGNPINITNSQTPGCDRNCDSDVWPSLAERVNDTLHILYVNDKSAGTIIFGQGDPVLNPVLYYKYPAFHLGDDCFSTTIYPNFFEDVVTTPGSIIDTFVKILPCVDLTIDSVKTKGSVWLQILNVLDSFRIVNCESIKTFTVNVRFDAAVLTPSTYIDTIIIYANSYVTPGLRVPVHLIVSDCGYFKRSQVVATVGDLRVKFSNTSNLGDQDPFNGFYLTSINENFLVDGTSVITTITADGDTIAAQDIFYNRSFKPLSAIDTQTVNLTDSLTYYQALQWQRPAKAGTWLRLGPIYKAMFFPDLKTPDIPWPGHWFGYQICETWWIKVTTKPRYVLWFTKIFKADPPCWWPLWPGELLVNNIYAGSVLDWDVPSDSGFINTGAYTDTFKLIYQRGRGVPYNLYYAGIAAMVDINIHLRDSTVYNPDWLFGAHILSNAKYVYPTGGFEDSTLYQWLSKPGVKHDFVPYEDISSILTSVRFDTTKDTVRYVQALAVSNLGYDSLKYSVYRARLDMRITDLIGDCFIRACDVDDNHIWNVTDIIGLVNIVFKGAVKPAPLCRTDCNASGGNPTLTDIIYLVNKIFKGGPNPIPIGECCQPL